MDANGNGANGRVVDLTAQERAALVTFQILEGAQMTTGEIAQQVGVTPQGAWHMMQRVARVVPLYQDAGRWRRLDDTA